MSVGVAIGWFGLIVSVVLGVLLMVNVLNALPPMLIVVGFALVFACIAFGWRVVGPSA